MKKMSRSWPMHMVTTLQKNAMVQMLLDSGGIAATGWADVSTQADKEKCQKGASVSVNGRHIASVGCPWQLWEDTVTSIDAHMLLYPLVQQGTYNQRAFSSLLCEQFFSEMTGDDKTGHQGTLTARELTRHFGTVCEMLATRLDPHRKWDMRTKKSSVYPVVTTEPRHDCPSTEMNTCLSLDKRHIIRITPRNHAFDLIRRRKSQRKAGHISGPNEPSRGARGVRQHHRVDESKMLPSTRAGIGL
ncbi:uncharacterized protein LOC144927280 [Branchiostoma floridae x Branchiostoma belcheri]